jgi:hypothetical protein
MKKVLYLITILLLAGCTINNIDDTPLITINEFLNSNITSYSQTMIDNQINCLNGTCPTPIINDKVEVKSCWFCNNSYTGIKGENLKVSIGPSGFSDSSFGCSIMNTMNEITEEFKIITKTKNNILVNINKTGTVKQSGDCENYEYDYVLIYEWNFTK